MGASLLRTRIRRMEEEDVQIAQESPPPQAFTVPAFRARKHRGGESRLLKDTFPSGFSRPPPSRPPLATTTTTAIDTISRRKKKKLLSLSGPYLRELLHESKEVGVPPWGTVSDRRTLEFTRVVIGASDVVDIVGSELIQFGPGFSVGPTEHLSPKRSTHRPDRPRPRTPATPISPSRVTIDGSALREQSNILLDPSPVVHCGNQWPRQNIEGTYRSEGRKRIRPATASRAQSPGGPEPWLSATEQLTGLSSRPHTAQVVRSGSWERGCLSGVAATRRVSDVGNGRQAFDRVSGVKECAPAAATAGAGQQNESLLLLSTQTSHHHQDDTRYTAEHTASSDSGERGPTPTGKTKIRDQPSPPEARISNLAQRAAEEEARDRRVEKRQDVIALLDDDELTGRGGRNGKAWAIDARNDPSVWSSDGSACILPSVVTNDGSAVYTPSIGDGSVEQVSAKRSFSTLDTELYRSILSKDATDIIRSHFECRNKPPTNSTANSCSSDSRDTMARDISPASPLVLPGQLLDNPLAARGRGRYVPFRLPPVDRSPETCYVRTRNIIVLTVVRKKELLECDDDAGVRNLKTAARSVRIKANMTLAEGMRAILASGVLRDTTENRDRREGRRLRRAGAGGDARDASGWALEYFSYRAGAWEVVGSESDWKILLGAPAGPQGAGVVFRSAGAMKQGADFLVAVSPIPMPLEKRVIKGSTPCACAGYTLKATLVNSSKENQMGWRYANCVTPGVLRFLETSAHRRRPANRSRGGARDDSESLAPSTTAEAFPFADTRETKTHTEDENEQEGENEDHRLRLAAMAGRRRRARHSPGAALWLPTSTTNSATLGRGTVGSPARRPKKAKVRRLVRHLEAGLKLKGRPGAGGLPVGAAQKMDMPYTKELAKWSYDEILGIPRSTVLA